MVGDHLGCTPGHISTIHETVTRGRDPTPLREIPSLIPLQDHDSRTGLFRLLG